MTEAKDRVDRNEVYIHLQALGSSKGTIEQTQTTRTCNFWKIYLVIKIERIESRSQNEVNDVHFAVSSIAKALGTTHILYHDAGRKISLKIKAHSFSSPLRPQWRWCRPCPPLLGTLQWSPPPNSPSSSAGPWNRHLGLRSQWLYENKSFPMYNAWI